MSTVLVIEDDPRIQKALHRQFSAEGYSVHVVGDGAEGLAACRTVKPVAVILDLMLPGISGRDVCKGIKTQFPELPVIILSAVSEVADKVLLLELGADDYVTKPFGIQELLARVRAHLRRAPERTAAAMEVGDFVIDALAHSISVQGKPIHLTPKEFDLVVLLARHAGKVMTHRALLTSVWGAQSAHQPEYLRVFVGQVRKKLEAETGRQYIQTEPWVGYRFIPEGWAEGESEA
jgi:two-component system KDP operon response regulator KdpE